MSPPDHFVGNALCLDFANTVNRRPNPTRDSLADGAALLEWATTGAVPLHATAAEAAAGLPALRALRDAVYAVFHAIASGDDPPEQALRAIAVTYARALPHARWQRNASRIVPTWESTSPQALRWRVAASALDVLHEGPLERIGSCPRCGWLFLDTSRNGRRRWCSMDTCGGRAKSARHYAKRKSDPGPPVQHQ